MKEEDIATIATEEFAKEAWVGLETLRLQQVFFLPQIRTAERTHVLHMFNVWHLLACTDLSCSSMKVVVSPAVPGC